jgi:hypothetical protein
MLKYNRQRHAWLTEDKRFVARRTPSGDYAVMDLDTYNTTDVASLKDADEWIQRARNS